MILLYRRDKYKVIRQYGLIAEIENAEKNRLTSLEDLVKLEYFI